MGAPVSKVNIIKAFKDLALAAGMPSSVRITGHSCRVTGAQRMAAAGISEWRIQVFGRWGSDAVLKYIREAAIDANSHHLAAEVEEALTIPLRQFVAQVGMPQVPRQVQELALEELSSDRRAGDEDIKQLALDFARHCTDVQTQLRDMGAKVLPSAVVCRASGKAHKIDNALSTLCGWSWSADPRTTLPVGAEWEGGWCRRCINYADRLVGGAPSTQGVLEALPVPS